MYIKHDFHWLVLLSPFLLSHIMKRIHIYGYVCSGRGLKYLSTRDEYLCVKVKVRVRLVLYPHESYVYLPFSILNPCNLVLPVYIDIILKRRHYEQKKCVVLCKDWHVRFRVSSSTFTWTCVTQINENMTMIWNIENRYIPHEVVKTLLQPVLKPTVITLKFDTYVPLKTSGWEIWHEGTEYGSRRHGIFAARRSDEYK